MCHESKVYKTVTILPVIGKTCKKKNGFCFFPDYLGIKRTFCRAAPPHTVSGADAVTLIDASEYLRQK